MHAADTILAVASAPGVSARAIIRVSGVGVGELCERVLTTSDPQRAGQGLAVARRAETFRAVLSLVGVPSLPVLAFRFVAPASYTGEDVLEIQLPGNPHLVERVVRGMLTHPLTVGAGGDKVRLAHPGEFTARAYFNRKLTLEQAEGVAATIAARTKEQLVASRLLLDGRTGQEYRALADECWTLLALVESGIDFADQEDVVPIAPSVLRDRLLVLSRRIGSHLDGEGARESASALPKIAIMGRPNAGKSTLFNALLGRERAVASPLAGTTRDVLVEPLDLSKDSPGSGEVLLMDLPGLDDVASDTSERIVAARGRPHAPAPQSPAALAQVSAREALSLADAIIWCDPTGRFDSQQEVDSLALSREQLAKVPILRVRTFGDQLGVAGASEPVRVSSIAVCALDGWNLAVLRRALADLACSASAGHLASLLPRHRLALRRSGASIAEAIEAIDPAARSLSSPELVAGSLRNALDSLGELVGDISPDDVLGRVFATFCVGK